MDCAILFSFQYWLRLVVRVGLAKLEGLQHRLEARTLHLVKVFGWRAELDDVHVGVRIMCRTIDGQSDDLARQCPTAVCL